MSNNIIIKRLLIENFRGIIEVDIPLSKKNLLLYGENGSGKSSFIDAFEYLVHQKIERFERQDVKGKSIQFVGQNRDTIIKLFFEQSGKEIILSIKHPSAEIKGNATLLQWLDKFASYPPILRRSHIVQFIEIKGAERLQQLSNIIGLEIIDSVKKDWGSEKQKRLNDKKSVDTHITNQERRLEELTKDLAGVELIDKVNSKIANVGLLPISTLIEIEDCKQNLSKQIADTTTHQAYHEASQVNNSLSEAKAEINSFIENYDDFHLTWKEFVAQKSNLQNDLLNQFLSQGKELLNSPEYISTCPLCEQEIDPKQLQVRVSTRIQELEAFNQLSQNVTKKQTEMRRKANNTLELIRRVNNSSLKISLDLTVTQEWIDALSELIELQTSDILSLTYPDPSEFKFTSKMAALEIAIQAPLDTYINELKAKIGNTEIAAALAWLGNIEEAYKNYEDARRQQKNAELSYNQICMMQEALTKAREKRLNEINADIAKTVNEYYQQLHPEEGYGDIQLVSERKGLGIGITADYHGRQSHPIGFYSEGHLDSLGIAIFLAYIKRFSSVKILILDDIMATIDGAHRLRLAHLLADEFKDYQIILTTHDRLWTEELHGVLKELQTVQLYWDIHTGVQTKELLEQKWTNYINIAKTEPADGVAKCARDFEKFLNQMRFNLSLSIPAKQGDRYTIGELLETFFSWFKKRKIANPENRYEKFEEIEEKINSHIKLRNWAGAHYNEWAANMTSTEAIDFIKHIQILVELFTCPCCNKNWLSYNKTTKIIYCKRCVGKPNAPNWPTK